MTPILTGVINHDKLNIFLKAYFINYTNYKKTIDDKSDWWSKFTTNDYIIEHVVRSMDINFKKL